MGQLSALEHSKASARQKLEGILTRERDWIADNLDPDFVRYFRRMLGDSRRIAAYVRSLARLSELGSFHGHLLDVACGYGVTSVVMRVLGVPQVTGVDVSARKVAAARRLVEMVGVDGIRLVGGNATAIPLRRDAFDCALVKDAVSHVADRDTLFVEVRRVLKPGGTLIISDDRNGLNPEVRVETMKLWEISEFGSGEELAGLGLRENFCDMRRRFLARTHPGHDAVSVESLARKTRGHTYRTLVEAVRAIEDGRSRSLQPVAPCVDPATETPQEILLDPIELVDRLARLGFESRIHLGTSSITRDGRPSTWWAQMAFRHTARLSWRLHLRRRRAFEISAVKKLPTKERSAGSPRMNEAHEARA